MIGYKRKHQNKKWVAHTKNDKRYKRSNRVKMHNCPYCTSQKLIEKSDRNQVWVECLDCHLTGYDCRIKDSHLWIAEDLIATLVDANEDLEKGVEEEEEEEEDLVERSEESEQLEDENSGSK